MNLDKKLELAHGWAIERLKDPDYVVTMDTFAIAAWQYADAMEAEYNKRLKEQKDKIYDPMRQKIQEQELDVKWHQQRVDHLANEMKVSQIVHGKEWQPDWSQAPGWANWWAMHKNGNCEFFEFEPYIIDNFWFGNTSEERIDSLTSNYQGDWKDSLRKKP